MRHWQTTENSNVAPKPEILIFLELWQADKSNGKSRVFYHAQRE